MGVHMNVNLYSNKKLSKEAVELLRSGIGFRDDTCYGSGVENFSDIIAYETFTLCNTDILRKCRELYELNLDLRKKKESIQRILYYIYDYYKTDRIYAKWFGLRENVRVLYGSEISVYRIPINSLIVSDLGYDGCLFVSKDKFYKI